MKIAIAGAGAMGCRLGYQLIKSGVDVVLIDKWQAHVEAIKANGLHVTFNGEPDCVQIPIYYPHEIDFQVDVVILLSKALQLNQMLEDVRVLCHADTQVVCLLNGLGYERQLLEYVKPEQLIMGTTIWTAALQKPGHVHLEGVGSIAVQHWQDSRKEKAIAIATVLDNAGLTAQYSDDVLTAIWRKSCVNGSLNALSAILECNLEQLVSCSHIDDLMYKMINEFVVAAKTQGVTLDATELTTFCIDVARRVGAHLTSMHQDLVQNHRKTEIDVINGEIVRLGKIHGFETPYNDMIVQMIHMKEEILKAE